MRVVVLGGTNFIGPYVLRLLVERGHDVSIYHRGRHEPELPASVRHLHSEDAALPITVIPSSLRETRPDVALHMFPVGEQDSRAFMESFSGYASRVVAISSADVYRAYGVFTGMEAGVEPVPLTEDARLRTVHFPYKVAADKVGEWARFYEKIVAEQVLMSWPGLPATILRLPAVYGAGDPQHRFFPYLKRMLDNRPTILLGKAQAKWRWTHGYVRDVASAIVDAVENDRATGHIYNLGELETPTLEQRLTQLAKIMDWKGQVITLPQPELPSHLQDPFNYEQSIVCDSRGIREELGWSEKTSKEDALRETIAWQLAHAPPVQFDYAAEDRAAAGAASR